MRFKDVRNNSVIKEIGSLFRRHDSSDWHINVRLQPNQEKHYFGISQIPILARHRVLNPIKQSNPAGFQSKIGIENTYNWQVKRIEMCPVSAICRQNYKQQWCFNFESNGTQYYLPQLELARVLFFHCAYITRLSLIPSGLIQEFDVQRLKDSNKALINILPTCTLPLYARGDLTLRRLLAWMLLDNDAQQSFNSIAKYQLQQGYNINKYRLWNFQFNPPQLRNVQLALRGYYENKLNVFFVYEIYGVFNLTCNCPEFVDFIDPRFAENRTGSVHAVSIIPSSATELVVNDEQKPNSNRTEIQIDTPVVTFEFTNPIQTNRIGKSKIKTSSRGSISEQSDHTEFDSPKNTCLEVSTDETSTHGSLPSADYDSIVDKSNDSDFYADKFKAFNLMVMFLAKVSDYKVLSKGIRKLPKMNRCSKHLLPDGNARCIAFYFIKKDNQTYYLIEVDTSDNKNRLSTLLLTGEPILFTSWDKFIRKLEIQLLKCSLAWPTSFLEQSFSGNYKRIPHQKLFSGNKILLDQKYISRWADRVSSTMSGTLIYA